MRDREPVVARAVLTVFGNPRVLALTLWFAKKIRQLGIADMLAILPGRAGFAMAMLASTNRKFRGGRYGASARAADRGSTVLLRGGVLDGLFRETNLATDRTLGMNGYAGHAPPPAPFRGAPPGPAGDPAGPPPLLKTGIND